MSRCTVKYAGESYPHFHGTRCDMAAYHDRGAPHGGAKHMAWINGIPLSWYTPKQKAARAKEKAPKAQP